MREVARDVAAGVYTPQGSYLFANLPSLSNTDVKVGYVYDIIDDFTTTSDFREGAGIEVPAGTNIVVADVSGSKKWDLLGFNIDLSPYQKKTMSAPVPVGGTPQSTVEGAIGALASLPGPNAYLSTATKTLTGSTLEAGSIVRVMFTADITGTDTTTALSLIYNGSPIAVKVNKNGSLSNFVAVETSTSVYKYLQAYTVLDLLYDGTQFIINGNPIVLSSTDYTIYANGKIGDDIIGTIKPFYLSSAPIGWLELDGSTFDTSKYSELYSLLGTNELPDFRECVLVGAGQSSRPSTELITHDVYTVGQFKDDQLQKFGIARGCDASGDPTLYLYSASGTQTGDNGYNNYVTGPVPATLNGDTPRTGTTTHGKQVGVLYCIKAL